MGGGPNGKKIVSYDESQICVISSCTAMHTIDPNSIECMPCESQCIKYLSEVIKREECDKINFHYVRFPFGLINADGLRFLRRVFEEMH